jgi:hypothetical protein
MNIFNFYLNIIDYFLNYTRDVFRKFTFFGRLNFIIIIWFLLGVTFKIFKILF